MDAGENNATPPMPENGAIFRLDELGEPGLRTMLLLLHDERENVLLERRLRELRSRKKRILRGPGSGVIKPARGAKKRARKRTIMPLLLPEEVSPPVEFADHSLAPV